MNLSEKKIIYHILTIAVISGISRVAIDYLARMANLNPLAYYATFLIAFILEIIIIVSVIKKYQSIKKEIVLMDMLKVGVIIMGVIGLSYCFMAYIYDMHIDPNFQTNTTLKFTEQFSPEQLEQVKKNIQNQDVDKSYFGVIMYTIWFVFLGAVISLVTSAVLKTKKETL